MPIEVSKKISSLPYQIQTPGSYRLEEDLSCASGDYAIRILAPNVTLDLQGHKITSNAQAAILLNASCVTICNGSIEAHLLAIASEPQLKATSCQLKDLKTKGGILYSASDLQVTKCTIQGGLYGIKAGAKAHLSHCLISGSQLLGVEVEAGSQLVDCTISDCHEGVYAYGSNQAPCYLEKVVVYNCQGLGLRMDGPGTVFRCEAHHNGLSEPAGGILAGPASIVKQCEAYSNQGGDLACVDPCELIDNHTSASE